MKTILRKVSLNHVNNFTKWWRDKELVALTSGNFDKMSDKEILDSVSSMAKNKLHWMIEADAKTVGHIDLEKINSLKAELQIVIGEKEYWGKGVAKEAVLQVLDKATNLGFKDIYLEVRPTNIRAISFYEKIGFEKMGIKKYPANQSLPTVITMEKELVNDKKSKNVK